MASRAILSLAYEEAALRPRYSGSLAAKLSTTADDLDVRVREIWGEGATVEGAVLPRPGKDVLLVRAGREAFGAVVARDGGRCTIEFDEEMDEAELLMWLAPIAEDGKASEPPRFRRPGLRTRRPSAEEWETIRSLGLAEPSYRH